MTRLTPLMPATASSIRWVTSDSTSSGAAPGKTTPMLMNGKLTSGKRSMPSRPIDTTPSTMKLRMTIEAKTGRLIEVSEIHMGSSAACRCPLVRCARSASRSTVI